jgi:hypothetical protein
MPVQQLLRNPFVIFQVPLGTDVIDTDGHYGQAEMSLGPVSAGH